MTVLASTTGPLVASTGSLVDGRYRLVKCMERSADAGAEQRLTWRAHDEKLRRIVRVEVISAPADAAPDAEVMLLSRCIAPSAVLDAGEFDGTGSVFLVTAFTDAPAVRATRARRRLFTRGASAVSAHTA